MLPTRSYPRQFAVTGGAEVAFETAGDVTLASAAGRGAGGGVTPAGGPKRVDFSPRWQGGAFGDDGLGAPASGGDDPGGGAP